MMNDKKYLDTQKKMIDLAKEISTLDMAGYLDRISNAETLGPILDPTMARKAGGNLEALKLLAKSLIPVQMALEKLTAAVFKTHVKDQGGLL